VAASPTLIRRCSATK